MERLSEKSTNSAPLLSVLGEIKTVGRRFMVLPISRFVRFAPTESPIRGTSPESCGGDARRQRADKDGGRPGGGWLRAIRANLPTADSQRPPIARTGVAV